MPSPAGLTILLSAVLIALVATTLSRSPSVRDAAQRWQWPVGAWRTQDWLEDLDGGQAYVLCASGTVDAATARRSAVPRIYTGQIDEHGEAEAHACLAVRGNRVANVGTASELQAWCQGQGPHCVVHELEPGKSIVPGLHDAHGHVLDLGWARSVVDLVGAHSRQEVVRRIEEFVKARPDLLADKTRWVQGLGWDQTKWDPPTFPSADDLASSPLLAGRKVMLRRIDVHALWLSRPALDAMELAGVMPPAGVEIDGGLVVRDQSGRPSGCLIDKAMDLAYKVIPPWTDQEREQYLEAAARELLSVGITSVGDAAVDVDTVRFYINRQKSATGLPFRIYVMLACPPDRIRCADLAAQHGLPIFAKPFSNDRLTVRTVKLFADGALGSWGSAMWEPYDDRPDWNGLLLIPAEEVEPLMRYWVDAGWNVATHCIGDRAQSVALDAYESILRGGKVQDPRFRIEHAQIVRKQDIVRFGSAGVIASMQPTHCTSDMGYVETRIGERRAREGAYAWASLLAANASLALGSDFPVELPNPIHGFYSAVSRLDAEQHSPDGAQGWHPEQRLTRAQALHGFTVAPSFAQFEEHIGGSLTQGKRADFVILNGDLIRQQDVRALRDTQIEATFIDGKMVWRRSGA